MFPAASREGILTLVSYCLRGREGRKITHLWLDCVCIDQQSQLEKQREVVNAGIICPWGIDKMGPPTLGDGLLPIWHHRAWTSPKVVLAEGKAEYLY